MTRFNKKQIKRLLKQHELGNLRLNDYKELADRLNSEPSLVNKIKRVM